MIVTATARLVTNPAQVERESADRAAALEAEMRSKSDRDFRQVLTKGFIER